MRTLAVCLLPVLALGLPSRARADDSDATLRFYLSGSELVAVGRIASEPFSINAETGVPNYPCEFSIAEVLKGDASLAGRTVSVNIVRFEMDVKDRHPLVRKDADCILFLKNVSPDKPAWQTADFWFGVQQAGPSLARSLKRVAAEMLDRTADFVIQCRRRDDRIAVKVEGARVVFEITSPGGIGGAQISRKEAGWPTAMVLRMRLAGLESLTIGSGATTLRAAALSHGNYQRWVCIVTDCRDGPPLDASSPFWTEVRAFTADGQPTGGLPGKDGWFELALPAALLGRDLRDLEVNWIDSHR